VPSLASHAVFPRARALNTLNHRAGVLIIGVMVASLLLLSLPGGELWRKVLQDTAHGAAFAIIASVLALMQSNRTPRGPRSFAVLLRSFVGAVGIGVVTEFLQYFQPGRTAAVLDALNDAAGAALGLALLAIVESRLPSPDLRSTSPGRGRGEEPSPDLRSKAIAVALASLTVLSWQPIQCAIAYAQRAADFPVLADGSNSAGPYFVRTHGAALEHGPLPVSLAGRGDVPALKVQFSKVGAPRIEIVEPYPDWRGYRVLAVDLANPGRQALPLVLRVFDDKHDMSDADRLNLPVVVPPGTRATVRVAISAIESAPARRPMDLAAIANVALYPRGPSTGATLYISRIWLE
jgi:hypothetical protein